MEAVEEFGPSLQRMAKSYVRDHAAAEDVVQETWIGFLSSLSDYQERCSIKTWLFRILFHKAQARVRVDQRLIAFSALVADEVQAPFHSVDESRFRQDGEAGPAGHWTSPPPAWKTSPEQILLDKESMTAVRAAIEELPPAQATVILMRDVEGLSSKDVCRSLSLSAANQRVLLHRARTAVRNTLEARYGGRP